MIKVDGVNPIKLMDEFVAVGIAVDILFDDDGLNDDGSYDEVSIEIIGEDVDDADVRSV
ncbi:hypothetical protein I2483_13580, partial [Sporosarcina sp. E16_3]|nr:hypothetical protein [Sporosarcina sp. E16_3]